MVKPVTADVALVGVLTLPVPEVNVQAPVPNVGVVAFKLVVAKLQIV